MEIIRWHKNPIINFMYELNLGILLYRGYTNGKRNNKGSSKE